MVVGCGVRAEEPTCCVKVGGGRKDNNMRKVKHRHSNKTPRLYGYCSSRGMRDQHVVARMSNGERCLESAKLIGYCARGLGSDINDMAREVGRAASGLGSVVVGVAGVVGALFGKDIIGRFA